MRLVETGTRLRYALTHGTRKKFMLPDEHDPYSQMEEDAADDGPPPPPPAAVALDKDVEALSHPDLFLRLDESKLPVETFDSLEYEEKDRAPEDWMSTATRPRATAAAS